MKKGTLLTCVILLQLFYLNAQQISIEWQKCLGGSGWDGAFCIQQTTDEGYIVGGSTDSNDGDVSGFHGGFRDFWVVKLDNLRNIEWQKCLGGSNWDELYCIQQTTDEGYIATGFTDSNDGDVSGFHGGFGDFWVVKLDNSGNIEWQKCLGGSDYEESRSIQQTTDGGYIVTGLSLSNDGDVSGNHGNSDYWVVKLDNLGNIEWQKCLGTSFNEYPYCIQETMNGGYIVTGAGDASDGSRDIWVVKLDLLGNIEWQEYLGGSEIDWALSIQQTTEGGYIIAGYSKSNDGDVSGNHGEEDSWIVKLDNFGNIEWQKCLGGSLSDVAFSVQQTTDGGYIVTGEAVSNDGDVSGNHGGDGDYWVVKLNNLGNIEHQICLGGSDIDWSHTIQQTTNGGFIVGGLTTSTDGDVSGNHGSSDFWILGLAIDPVGLIDNELQNYMIYPNPFHDNITIKRSNSKEEEYIKISNISGNVLNSYTINSGEMSLTISTNHLVTGTYFLHVYSMSETRVIKLMKE